MSNATDNDVEDELHLQPINHGATRDELIEALKASQLSVVKLLAENRQLRTENANLRANSSKKRRNIGANDNLLGYQSEILRFAKSFLFTRALLVPIAAFQPNTVQLPEDPRGRFENNETYIRSITSALYEDIPEKFHSLLDVQTYSNFAKDFIREHGEGRSALIGVIRKALPVILKGHSIDSSLLTNAKADRSKDNTIDRLLRFPTERKATLYPPILFPGPTQNMKEVFTGPIIMNVHRLMYFGPSSLTLGSKPAQNSNGIKLGFHDVTEASVSAAVILTRFVLSTDAEWAAKGAISKIEWEEEYRAYHKMLACNRHLLHVKAILRKIHRFVFAGTTSSLTTASNPTAEEDEETEEAISDALRRFELGLDPMSDPEDDAHGNGTGPAAQPDPNVGVAHAPEEPPEEPTREDRAEEEEAAEVRGPAQRRTRSGKATQRRR
ncbi:hypothetical protein B0H13DRAFT_2382582 [Mycena leptocephala]|nr:hypothetical protein B0H13DRAFT_2382582 [Mycena leptocephala]